MEAVPAPEVEVGEKSLAIEPRWLNQRGLLFITLLAAGLVYAQFDVFRQPVRGDRANWEYMAQIIARGGVPYRDAVNIKTPLSAYLGAVAILVTRPFGVRDIYSVRVLYLLLGVLTAGMICLVAYEYFESLRVALLSVMIFLSFHSFTITNSAGIQPKTPMILFGLCSLWAIRKDKPLWAGVLAMLSALSWQPGLLYFGAAGLAFSVYLTSWRDARVMKLILGASVPLAVMLVYFWFAGALSDFYLWALKYNVSVYAPEEIKPLSFFFQYFDRMLAGSFRGYRVFSVVTVLGLLVALVEEAVRVMRGGAAVLRVRAPFHALIITLLVYFFFCGLNVQGSADFFPFLPYVAMFAAVAVVAGIDLMVALVARSWPAQYRVQIGAACTAVMLLLVFLAGVADAFGYRRRGFTLQDQEAEVQEVKSYLQPGEEVFVHALTEVLVIGGLTSSSRHFFLDRDKDMYLNQVEPGGFDGWFERLKASRPRIVLLSRMRKVRSRALFNDWVASEYDQHRGEVFTYYVRKDLEADSSK